MKKILLIISFLVAWSMSFSQTFTPPRSSPVITVQDSRYRALLNFYFTHTHGLTMNGGLDSLGMSFYEDSTGHIWYRDTVLFGGHKWSMVLKTGDAGQGTVTKIIAAYGFLPLTITDSGTLVLDTATLSNYWVRRRDSTTVFVTPTQMNAQGFLKNITGISAGGDLTGTYQNPTIALNAVSFAKMQQIPGFSFVANPTASPANPQASYFKYGLIWNNDSLKVDTTTLKLVFGQSVATGITQLTGDGTTPTGGGVQPFTLITVNGNVYGSNTFLKFSVNAKGLTTAAIPVTSGDITTVLGFTPIPLTALSATSPIVYNNVTGVFSCPTCGVSSGGITTLNGLTAANQTFAIGYSGTSFNIVSNTSTHTFNIPITGSDTGMVTPALYTTWNAKINLTSLSAILPLSYNNATGAFSEQQGNTSQNGYISSTDWNTFNGKQAALIGTGYVTMSGTTPSYTSGAATNIMGYNASGGVSAIILGTNLSMTGNTLNAAGGGGSQTLTYTQLALNNTLSISGGNTQTFLTATELLAGLLDTSRAKTIDSIHNRTFVFAPDTIHIVPYGTGAILASTNTAGSIFYTKTGENSTTNSITLNSDSSFSVNSLLSGGSSSISISGAAVSFLNDNPTPGAWALYGPNGSATKGWNAFTSYPLANSTTPGLLSAAGYVILSFQQTILNSPVGYAADSVGSASITQDTLYLARHAVRSESSFLSVDSTSQNNVNINVWGIGLTNQTANTLLGYNASGVPSVITAGGGITIASGVISSSGGGGGSGHTYYTGPGIRTTFNDTTFKVDSVWNFRSIALSPTTDSEANNVYEPVVYRDIHPVILSSGSDTIFKMWYDAGWGGPNVNYAESYTGQPGTWVKYSSNPIIHAHNRTTILYKHGTDSIYAYVITPAATMDLYSSVDGVTFALLKSNLLTAGATGSWNASGFTNSWVIYDTTFKMIVDGSGPNGVTEGLYTSTDGLNWTPNAANPVLTMESPWFVKIGSTYWLWGHMVPKPSTGFDVIPSEIFGASSPDLVHWTHRKIAGTVFSALLSRLTNDEGVDSVGGQIADPALVTWAGPSGDTTMLFYDASPNGNAQGAAQYGFQVKSVEAFMGLAQLVTTNENANPYPTLTNYGNNLAYLTVNPNVRYGNLYLGVQPQYYDPPALLQIGGNSTVKAGIRFRVDLADTLTTTPAGGDLEAYARWLFYTGIDTSSHLPLARDTIAFRGWANAIFAGGFQGALNYSNIMSKSDTINQNGLNLTFYNGGSTYFSLLSLLNSSSTFSLNGGTFLSQDQIAGPQWINGNMTIHSYNNNNAWIAIGATDASATFKYTSAGGGAGFILRFAGGAFEPMQFPTGTAGANITNTSNPFYIPTYNGTVTSNFLINSTTDAADAQLQINTQLQPQLALIYNTSIRTTIGLNSSQILGFIGTINGVTFPSTAFPTGTTTDSVVVETTTSGVMELKKVAQSSIGGASYTFSNSLVNTSGTVTLVNDATSPGNSYYYGTNSGGTKGFFVLPSSTTPTLAAVTTAGATTTNAITTGAITAPTFSAAALTTGPQFTAGNLYLQGYNGSNFWIGFGVNYVSGNFTNQTGNAVANIRLSSGNLEFQEGVATTSGSTQTLTTQLNITNATGNVEVNTSTDFTNAAFQSFSNTQPQLAAVYSNTIAATIYENSSQVLNFSGQIAGVTFPSSAFPTGTTTDSVVVETTTSGVMELKKVAQSSIGGGVTTIGSPSTSYANGATISGATLTLGLANSADPGIVSANGTAQTLSGIYTFSGADIFSSNITFNGGMNTTFITGTSSTPSYTAGTGAGTSPTVTISGTAIAGTVSLTTGTSPAGTNAVILTVTGSFGAISQPVVILTPANPLTAALSGTTMIYVGTTAVNNFTINSGTLALAGSTAYKWNYLVMSY